jgi:putative sterol carrier protein
MICLNTNSWAPVGDWGDQRIVCLRSLREVIGAGTLWRHCTKMAELSEIMDGMAKAYVGDAVPGLDAIMQLNATGEGGGNFYITMKDGKAASTAGSAENPNLTLTISGTDWRALLKGELEPTMAFMTGKIKVSGDMALLMKFPKLFKRG